MSFKMSLAFIFVYHIGVYNVISLCSSVENIIRTQKFEWSLNDVTDVCILAYSASDTEMNF